MTETLVIRTQKGETWKISGTIVYIPEDSETWIHLVITKELLIYTVKDDAIVWRERWNTTFQISPAFCKRLLNAAPTKG